MTKYNQLSVQANKSKKRIGRGISAGQGKTAGRGTKGQKSRTGKKLRPNFAGGSRTLVTAIPKKRGFKSLRSPAQVVYLDKMDALAGKPVNNQLLYEANYITSPYQAAKVIARGKLTKKVDLKVAYASKSVIKAINDNGGSFTKTAVPVKPTASTKASK